ncbi:hypothetical protein BJ944DRAFT_237582 [Cunninghamella echinulata]|nr:hypothetical protein BJ944DRAFT_237582 [Cunninghamella echinulata]
MLATSNIDPTTTTTTKHQKVPTYDLFNSLSLFNTTTKNVPNEWADQYKEEYLTTNQGLINDFSSLSTSSFKEDFYDDYYLKQKDNHHHTTTMDLLSSDNNNNIKYQLNDAMDYIQLLTHKLKLLTDDLQQKQNTISNLQSTISVKEMELQDQNNRFLALNQLYESRQKNAYNENVSILKENADLKSKYQW